MVLKPLNSRVGHLIWDNTSNPIMRKARRAYFAMRTFHRIGETIFKVEMLLYPHTEVQKDSYANLFFYNMALGEWSMLDHIDGTYILNKVDIPTGEAWDDMEYIATCVRFEEELIGIAAGLFPEGNPPASNYQRQPTSRSPIVYLPEHTWELPVVPLAEPISTSLKQ